MIKIAIYGKGGIGKSTVTSGVAAALALDGHGSCRSAATPRPIRPSTCSAAPPAAHPAIPPGTGTPRHPRRPGAHRVRQRRLPGGRRPAPGSRLLRPGHAHGLRTSGRNERLRRLRPGRGPLRHPGRHRVRRHCRAHARGLRGQGGHRHLGREDGAAGRAQHHPGGAQLRGSQLRRTRRPDPQPPGHARRDRTRHGLRQGNGYRDPGGHPPRPDHPRLRGKRTDHRAGRSVPAHLGQILRTARTLAAFAQERDAA